MHGYVVEIMNIWQPQTPHNLLQSMKCASQQPYPDNIYNSSIYSFMIYLMPLSVLQTITQNGKITEQVSKHGWCQTFTNLL
jgi:hypothetical protein